jgi:putative membrane protein
MTGSQPPQSTSPADPEVTTTPETPPTPTAALKQTERPHPLTPFVRGWLVFVAIAIGYGRELITSSSENQFENGGLTWILPILGIVVVLAAAGGFVAWYFTRFVIDDEELRIETGAIFKVTKSPSSGSSRSISSSHPRRVFGWPSCGSTPVTAPRNCVTYAARRRPGS